MRYPAGVELPAPEQEVYRRALRLEWLSVAYFASAVVVIYFTLGQSQAMRAALIEDLLWMLPPIAFLVASRFREREDAPDDTRVR